MWIEENKRRDIDNISFGKKFILDSMVKAGKIKNDNQKYVKGFTDDVTYANKAGVILEIEEIKEVKEKAR